MPKGDQMTEQDLESLNLLAAHVKARALKLQFWLLWLLVLAVLAIVVIGGASGLVTYTALVGGFLVVQAVTWSYAGVIGGINLGKRDRPPSDQDLS